MILVGRAYTNYEIKHIIYIPRKSNVHSHTQGGVEIQIISSRPPSPDGFVCLFIYGFKDRSVWVETEKKRSVRCFYTRQLNFWNFQQAVTVQIIEQGVFISRAFYRCEISKKVHLGMVQFFLLGAKSGLFFYLFIKMDMKLLLLYFYIIVI